MHFFDVERRDKFKGPSWELPLAVPLTPKETVAIGELFPDAFGAEYDAEGNLGITVEIDDISITVPDVGDWDPIGDGGLSFDIVPVEVDLLGIPDPADSDLLELVVTSLALNLTIANDVGLNGTLRLKVEGGEEVAPKEVELDALTPKTFAQLTVPITDETNKLTVGGTIEVEAGNLPDPGTLTMRPEAWVPLAFNISDGGEVNLSDPEPLNLDEETREMLNDVPISELALVVQVQSHLPFGFKIGFELSDGAGGNPLVVDVLVPADAEIFSDDLTIDEAVREKLTEPDVYVQPKLTFVAPEDGRTIYVREEHYFDYKLHALARVQVNKEGN